jgi:cytidylate kinase
MRTVIAISRQFGSGGAWVGRALAQQLGYRYADREILAEAAQKLNVETSDLEPLEERVRDFWWRLGAMFSRGAVEGPFMPPPPLAISEADLFAAEREIIETIAEHGNAVIVGRGAAHLLRDRPGVLRVFLYAPFDTRVALAIREYSIRTTEEAAALVRASDAQRARFARTVSVRDWCDASSYDLSLNTGTMTLERVVDIIVDVVRQAPPTADLPVLAPRPQP